MRSIISRGVPNNTVKTGQNGSFVYLAKPDRNVEYRAITTGARVDRDMVIEKGLESGENRGDRGPFAPGARQSLRFDR